MSQSSSNTVMATGKESKSHMCEESEYPGNKGSATSNSRKRDPEVMNI